MFSTQNPKAITALDKKSGSSSKPITAKDITMIEQKAVELDE